MQRLIDSHLREWKDSRQRKPLIVRGARQVGKTHSIVEFGRNCFKNLAFHPFRAGRASRASRGLPPGLPQVRAPGGRGLPGNGARRSGAQPRQPIFYTRLAEDHAHTTKRRTFDLLTRARLLTKVLSAVPSGLPLGAAASARRFKALLLDIGLWRHLCGGGVEHDLRRGDLLDVRRGAAAEQFVGQELRAGQGADLFYWSREVRGSGAEVDFLAVVDGRIHGIEVKSGAAGRLRSLHMLLRSYPALAGGWVFSSRPHAELPEQRLSFLPLYYAYSAGRKAGSASSEAVSSPGNHP